MDERIAKLKTPEACARFAKNAEDHGRPDLAQAAHRRSVELAAEGHDAKTEAEKECLQAVYAYERTLEAKHGRAVRASYTWRAIREHGIIEAVERAVTKSQETAGFKGLRDMGLEHLSYEAVVLRHPELFSQEAIMRARVRLGATEDEHNEAPKATRPTLLQAIEDADGIEKCQSQFAARVKEAATSHKLLKLGYQGGGTEVEAFHIVPLNFWVSMSMASSGNRYWNALGIGDPWHGGASIIAEVNPPKSGVDRRIAGLFVNDRLGNVYLAHRGRVGGGRKGIGKENFLDWYQGPMDLIQDGDKEARVIIIGRLDEPDLIKNLAEFTYAIAAFKDDAVRAHWRK